MYHSLKKFEGVRKSQKYDIPLNLVRRFGDDRYQLISLISETRDILQRRSIFNWFREITKSCTSDIFACICHFIYNVILLLQNLDVLEVQPDANQNGPATRFLRARDLAQAHRKT